MLVEVRHSTRCVVVLRRLDVPWFRRCVLFGGNVPRGWCRGWSHLIHRVYVEPVYTVARVYVELYSCPLRWPDYLPVGAWCWNPTCRIDHFEPVTRYDAGDFPFGDYLEGGRVECSNGVCVVNVERAVRVRLVYVEFDIANVWMGHFPPCTGRWGSCQIERLEPSALLYGFHFLSRWNEIRWAPRYRRWGLWQYLVYVECAVRVCLIDVEFDT